MIPSKKFWEAIGKQIAILGTTLSIILYGLNAVLENKYDLFDKALELWVKTISLGSKYEFISIGDTIKEYQDFFNSLNYVEINALTQILICTSILLCVISILSIIFGEFLISYLKLELRFPKIAKVIQIRRKLQKYYLVWNFSTIIFICIFTIYNNIIILLS
jgi:hypothetical protein